MQMLTVLLLAYITITTHAASLQETLQEVSRDKRQQENTDDNGAQIRLVGGTSPTEGRVEVLHNGAWGTVCHDLWDTENARVVCRQLGYLGDIPEAHTNHLNSRFGPGSGSILLDDVHCAGTENSLDECEHSGWGIHNCIHDNDAGVVCKPIQLRLVGGSSPFEGRVDVLYDGKWGTVCSNSWGAKDSTVVCRHLGLPGENAEFRTTDVIRPGVGNILLDKVQCVGNEMRLDECPHSEWGTNDSCTHFEDVIVTCKGAQIRLVGGSSPTEGRVEVLYNNEWGTVCGNSWGTGDAKVVCRQLGLNFESAEATSDTRFGQGTGSTVLKDVRCTGTENNLDKCPHSAWGSHDCSDDVAGVVCVRVSCDNAPVPSIISDEDALLIYLQSQPNITSRIEETGTGGPLMLENLLDFMTNILKKDLDFLAEEDLDFLAEEDLDFLAEDGHDESGCPDDANETFIKFNILVGIIAQLTPKFELDLPDDDCYGYTQIAVRDMYFEIAELRLELVPRCEHASVFQRYLLLMCKRCDSTDCDEDAIVGDNVSNIAFWLLNSAKDAVRPKLCPSTTTLDM